MSYHIRANYGHGYGYQDYTCDDYIPSIDYVVLYKRNSKGELKESHIISTRNKNFVDIVIEELGEKH